MRKILSVLLMLLLATPAFSQEAAKNRIFVLSDFSGGIATRLSDESNNTKYARISENIRLGTSVGDIYKRDQIYTYGTADTTEPITSIHRLYLKSLTKVLLVTHGDEIEAGNDTTGVFTTILDLTTADYRFQWETWHDLAIGGDGYNQPVKTDGTDATYLGTCFAEDNGAGAGPDGSYLYKVSFYTASYEVIFDVPSNSVTVVDNDIDLSMIPIGPDTFLGEAITGRKVYRNTVAAPAVWNLLSNGTIANNTATTLTDSDADGAVGAAYPAGDATWTPPKGKFYCISQNRLFIANNPTYPSRVWFSKAESHDLFESAIDYRDIRQNDGDEVTFIKNLLGVLRAGKTNTIQNFDVTGDDPDEDWAISDPLSFIGCDAPYSAVNTPLGIMYLSKTRRGLYVFNGQNSSMKSQLFTPVIDDILSSNLVNVCGDYADNIYYMPYASATVGGSTNNRMLVYDALLQAATIDTLNINALTVLSGSTDGGIIYGGASDSGKVYKFANTAIEIVHSKHADFTGTFDDARYIPTSQGADSNSPTLEISWDVTIDTYGAGTINAATGDVNRPDGTGSYISPVINTLGASTYDKMYWNELLVAGTNATFAIRSGATAAACIVAGWSATEYTNASGSDISGVTANEYTQYRITLSASDIDYTPNVYTSGGFTTKLTYNTLGTAVETAVAVHWRTPWIDFELPLYEKSLRKILIKHEGTTGTLTVTFTNEFGDTDTFSIDMSVYPTEYQTYFTNGSLMGKKFRIDITNSDLNNVKVESICLVYDVEPLV